MFIVRLTMKKSVAFFIMICCAVCTGYFTLYSHFYIKIEDNIPQASCTEIAGSDGATKKRRQKWSDIMIAIRITAHQGYTNFTASVIREYQDIPDTDLHVFTNEYVGYDTAMLRRMYGPKTKIIQAPSEQKATNEVLEYFIGSSYKILFLVDSEMVFLRGWREFITGHTIAESLPFLSLYHSATMHSYDRDCDHLNRGLCKGPISGQLGIAINKYVAKIVLQKHPEFGNFRFDWNEILQKEGLHGRYPTKSLIIRIGQTRQDLNFCGKNEVPYGFDLCELPCWIRNGIEFYFDLCTNPQEIYSRDFSIRRASEEMRSWVRPVISYSFYGNKARYVKGALENVKRVFTIYPGWKIWVYLDNTVVSEVVQDLCSHNVKFINMTGTSIKNQMSWRFLIAAEPVKWFQILDIDYRMIPRGKEAVDEWLESGRKFHVMRDHPQHSIHAMNGQMWGGYGNSIPNMKQLIMKYRARNWFMMDIHFLTSQIWPIVKKSVWVHDAYPLHKFGQDRPFPVKRNGDQFVGNVDFDR